MLGYWKTSKSIFYMLLQFIGKCFLIIYFFTILWSYNDNFLYFFNFVWFATHGTDINLLYRGGSDV